MKQLIRKCLSQPVLLAFAALLILTSLYFLPTVSAASFGTNLGSFNGVASFSNENSGYYSGISNTVNGVYTGIKWQCVEFVRRYYLVTYGLDLGSLYRGNANTWYDNASTMGLSRFPNGGSTAPQVGDVITSNGGSYGHVAIIRSVTSTQVCTIQQNFSNDTGDVNRCLSLTISGGNYTVGGFSASYPIRGWLRKPGTAPPPACTGGSSESYRVNGGPPLHPDGTLIIQRNTSTVYLIQNGQRRPISSPDVLHHLYVGENGEFDFADVITVASDELSRYPVGPGIFESLPANGRSQPDGRLIRAVGGGEISIVTANGHRRPFSLESVFLGLGYIYCRVVEVSDYNSYPAQGIVGGLEALPTITSSMTLSSGPYSTGLQITASFSITNQGNTSITLSQLLAGGRLNGSTVADFPSETNVTLSPGQQFNYQRVRSFSSSGNYQFFPAFQKQDGTWRIALNGEIGAASGIVQIVSATINTVSTPPAPTSLAASSIGSSSFSANWTSSSGATGYRLDVATNTSFTSFVSGYQNLDVGGVTSRSVTGLGPSTNYYFRVRAYNTAGTSGNSNTTSVQTSGASCSQSFSIAIGESRSGSLQSGDCVYPDGSYYDAYTFGGSAGQRIYVTLSSSQFDAYLFLYQGSYPGGSLLAQDNNGGGGTNARIPGASGYLTLPTTGTYTILANSLTAGGAGSYTLFLGTSSTATNKPFDFDSDGKTDIGVFRPSNGQWWINNSSNGQTVANTFGTSSDRIAPADYTGDGKTDIGIFRPSNGQWLVLRSEDSTFYGVPFGAIGDIPVPADYDADGKADYAVFRPSSSTWFISQSSGAQTRIFQFGVTGDQPVVADYDGDGKADVGIFRPGPREWWIQRSSAGLLATQFGATNDKAVQSDYTGDGKADIAIWRPSTGEWLIVRSENFSFYGFPFGANGDLPSPGDYDGDGKSDPTVFRPSTATWFIARSTAGTHIVQFGSPGDKPISSAFVP